MEGGEAMPLNYGKRSTVHIQMGLPDPAQCQQGCPHNMGSIGMMPVEMPAITLQVVPTKS